MNCVLISTYGHISFPPKWDDCDVSHAKNAQVVVSIKNNGFVEGLGREEKIIEELKSNKLVHGLL